jgi:2-polyprenyl-6-methoxyphenol hydroxylase-like FAD-dependent oxidoreductase
MMMLCHFHSSQVSSELKVLGDIISFGPNAGRIYRRWSNGKIADQMRSLSIDLRNYGFRIHKYDTGEVVTTQKTPEPDPETPVFNGHRGELHSIVFNYAKDELGIPIHLGHRVTQYWEDEDQAGIILDDGTKVIERLLLSV